MDKKSLQEIRELPHTIYQMGPDLVPALEHFEMLMTGPAVHIFIWIKLKINLENAYQFLKELKIYQIKKMIL